MSDFPDYILITGHGRSGTNWLLDIFDASPSTHCRNEPNEVLGSSLEYVRELWKSPRSADKVTALWETKVSIARISSSERDHRIEAPKNHVYTFAQKTGLASLPVRPKFRKVLRQIFPDLRHGEWPVPRWVGDRHMLEKSCTVLKINMLASWFVNWHVDQYSNRPVLHIVRHPAGYLNSSIRRFFSKCSSSQREFEHQFYQRMLRTAIEIAPEWEEIIGDVEALGLYEAVMWFWRVNNEMIFSVSQTRPNYHLLVYEDLVRSPVAVSRTLYEFCNLSWSDSIESLITNGLNTSVWGPLKSTPTSTAKAWKQKLSSAHLQLVEQVLDGSLLKSLWEEI